MRIKDINKAIKKLGPWYQRYEMQGKFTTDSNISDVDEWYLIRSLIEEDDLNGLRILDLGSNAGYFSVMMALEGADVIMVEPNPLYIKQTRWTKHFFEQTVNNKKGLYMTMKNTSASEIDYSLIGWCDYILASSVLYYIGNEYGAYTEESMKEQERVVSELCKLTNKIIVRTRNNRPENSIGYYNGLFLNNNFYMLKRIQKKRPLMLYGKVSRSGDYGI